MKKFLEILVLGLLWCNVSFAKDLTGVKLYCEKQEYNKHVAYEFISEKEVIVYRLYTSKKWMVVPIKQKYEVETDMIYFEIADSIHRETLEMFSITTLQCKIMPNAWNAKKEMSNILKELIKKQESLNKL